MEPHETLRCGPSTAAARRKAERQDRGPARRHQAHATLGPVVLPSASCRLYYRLVSNRKLGLPTFFCDPHSPWQKGGIENAIGRMRKPLPRKTDLATLRPRQLAALVANYNNTPRKCLGYKSPAQVFLAQLLHFECESTFRPSPE